MKAIALCLAVLLGVLPALATKPEKPAKAFKSHMELRPGQLAWIYDAGPNHGWLCGLLQVDGPSFEVYLPAAMPTPQITVPTPVPWVQFGSEFAALQAINDYCPLD